MAHQGRDSLRRNASHKHRALCRIWHSCSDGSNRVYVRKDTWSLLILGDLIEKMKKMTPILDKASHFFWAGKIINIMECFSFAVIVFIFQVSLSIIREQQFHSGWLLDCLCLCHSALDQYFIIWNMMILPNACNKKNDVRDFGWFRHKTPDAGTFIIMEGDKTTLNSI